MKIPFPKYEAEVVAEIEAYLDQDYQTEIVQEQEQPRYGIKFLFARGLAPGRNAPGTRQFSNYARPMIQPLDNQAFSCVAVPGITCGACGDFSRSWACPDHPAIECDPCHERRRRPSLPAEGCTDGFHPPAGLFDRVRRMYDRSLSQGPPQDPYQGIRRYVPVDGRDHFTLEQQAAERARQMEGEARLNALPDFTMTIEFDASHFLEVIGETAQQAGSLRIEVEGDDG